MARLDYQGTYTRCPAKPSPAYPQKREVWVPLVELALFRPGQKRGLKTWALLDTGATINLFPAGLADALGLDWKSAPTVPIAGISGGVDGHVLQVAVEIVDAKYGWKTDIAFCPTLTSPPILGHDGFFEHFEVRFDSRPQTGTTEST